MMSVLAEYRSGNVCFEAREEYPRHMPDTTFILVSMAPTADGGGIVLPCRSREKAIAVIDAIRDALEEE